MSGSFLAQERGFESRERDFRREMDILHSSTHSELTLQVCPHSIPHTAPSSLLQVERSRDKLLLGVIQQLQSLCDGRHASSPASLPPLCVYRIKVRREVMIFMTSAGPLCLRFCLRMSRERDLES